MELKLQKPLAFFDLETTGTNIAKDRIVEIAIYKIAPNGTKETKTLRINPECPIPPEVTAIHGISDADVAEAPTFKQVAKDVAAFIEGCDLAGYNSDRFDVPLLAEELLRAGVEYDMKKHRFVDVQTIFHQMEKRTLEAAYRFYCDKTLENAHSAEADAIATYEVLKGQLDKYEELENDVGFLSKFTQRRKTADFAGFIALNDKGEEVFNFGKHKGKLVETVLDAEPGYYAWMQKGDFPLYTKKVLTSIRLRKMNTLF